MAIAPCYVLWHHQEEFVSAIFVPALQADTGCCSITIWAPLHWGKQAQLPPPLSHRACTVGPAPWWQPSALSSPVFPQPHWSRGPKTGCCTPAMDTPVLGRWREAHGASIFSHRLILWGNVQCRHHHTSTHVPSAGCERGLNGWYKLGEMRQFQLHLKLRCQSTREPSSQDLHIISHAYSVNQSSAQCSRVLLFVEFIFQPQSYQNIVLYANFLIITPLLYVIHRYQAVYM